MCSTMVLLDMLGRLMKASRQYSISSLFEKLSVMCNSAYCVDVHTVMQAVIQIAKMMGVVTINVVRAR